MNTQTTDVNEMDEIDAMLADIESDEIMAEEDEVVEAAEASESDIEAAVLAAEIEEVDAEIESQEPEESDTPSEEEIKALTTEGDSKTKKPKGAKRASTVGLSRRESIFKVLGGKENAVNFFALDANDTDLESKMIDKLDEFDKLAKKVGEKLVNAFSFLNEKASLSSYTSMAIGALVEKGELTTVEMVDTYANNPNKALAVSTARAQTNQMFHLLPALEIAKRVGNKLVVNEDSTVLAHFKEVSI